MSVVNPRAKLHFARLIIEWKVGDIDFTGASKFGRRRPEDVAIGLDDRSAAHVTAGIVVGTEGSHVGRKGAIINRVPARNE